MLDIGKTETCESLNKTLNLMTRLLTSNMSG